MFSKAQQPQQTPSAKAATPFFKPEPVFKSLATEQQAVTERAPESVMRSPIVPSTSARHQTSPTFNAPLNFKHQTSNLPIQAKLTVGQPNDKYEQEADAMADKVVQRWAMPNAVAAMPTITPFNINAAQRACAACEKEDHDHIQRKESGEMTASPSVESRLSATKGGGNPLPESTRTHMESAIGADFSNVRVHTGGEAVQLSQDLSAHAFTHGSDVYFNSGKFSPNTDSGRHLLAHELTHTVQQKKSITTDIAQRIAMKDFEVRGLDTLSTSINVINFDLGSTAVDAVEQPKIAAMATPINRNLTLNGFASEEGSISMNTQVINQRIAAVSTALNTAGHTGLKQANPQPTASIGNRDYRSRRIVEIVDTPVPSPSGITPPVPTSVVNCAVTRTQPCGTAFTSVQSLSQTKVNDAIAALATPTAATSAHVATFFGSNTPSAVQTNIQALAAQMVVLIAAYNGTTDCLLDACDNSCGQGATAYFNPTSSKMLFCESFVNEPDADSRADTFIHESLHATPGVATDDIAYAHTRRIRTLSAAESLKNTDSYVNLISILHDPAAVISTPPVDNLSSLTSVAEQSFMQSSLDFLEQWLIAAKFKSGSLYDKIDAALSDPTSWQTPTAHFFHHSLHALSSDMGNSFGLTNPRLAPPFKLPTAVDKVKMAGISDRYFRMREQMRGKQVTGNKIMSGVDNWVEDSGIVNVTPSFFTASQEDAIKRLTAALIRRLDATRGDVSVGSTTAYVNGVNNLRILNSVGP
jgi:Domain of unknown function (DUF4157)/Lysine-specific metallo-endopeptidase